MFWDTLRWRTYRLTGHASFLDEAPLSRQTCFLRSAKKKKKKLAPDHNQSGFMCSVDDPRELSDSKLDIGNLPFGCKIICGAPTTLPAKG